MRTINVYSVDNESRMHNEATHERNRSHGRRFSIDIPEQCNGEGWNILRTLRPPVEASRYFICNSLASEALFSSVGRHSFQAISLIQQKLGALGPPKVTPWISVNRHPSFLTRTRAAIVQVFWSTRRRSFTEMRGTATKPSL